MAAGDAALRLYAILDAESCQRRGIPLLDVARAWRDAGVRLVQYRDKVARGDVLFSNAEALRTILPSGQVLLLLNDRPEMVIDTGFDGAHIGQGDTSVHVARALLGPDRLLGVSTHTAEQATAADAADVDYIAIGPVYATNTKKDAEAVVGLRGVEAARSATRKPLVAIGGIGALQCREVLEAGADAVALISGLLEGDVQQTASSFLQRVATPPAQASRY